MKKIPDHYDIDNKLADEALKTYHDNIDVHIVALSKLKDLLAQNLIEMKEKEFPKTQGRLQVLESQIDSFEKLKKLVEQFMASLKTVCLKQGAEDSEINYKKSLDNLLQHLIKMNAFKMDSQLKAVPGDTVLWSKIEPRMAKKLVKPGNIALESSLAGFLAAEKYLWGLKKWSSNEHSPVKMFWDALSEEINKATNKGSDVQVYVFEKIVPETILASVELPIILKKIEEKEVNSVQLYETKYFDNAVRKVYCLSDDKLPTDLTNYYDSYIFTVTNTVSLYYVNDNGIAQRLRIDLDEGIMNALHRHHNITDFKQLMTRCAEKNQPIENDSLVSKIRILLDAKKENKVFYLDKMPENLNQAQYKNAIFIMKDVTHKYIAFTVQDSKAQAITIQNLEKLTKLLEDVKPDRNNQIQDTKPSLYHYIRAIIARNEGHGRYKHLQVPTTPAILRNNTEVARHSGAYSAAQEKNQTAWFFAQKARKNIDKVLASPDFKNHSIFKAILIKTPMEVSELIRTNNIDVNRADKRGWTLLLRAAQSGNYGMVKALITLGAHVNQGHPQGITPLMIAACNNHFDVVKLLLESNADLSLKTKNGSTALTIAQKLGHTRTVEIIQNSSTLELKSISESSRKRKLNLGVDKANKRIVLDSDHSNLNLLTSSSRKAPIPEGNTQTSGQQETVAIFS